MSFICALSLRFFDGAKWHRLQRRHFIQTRIGNSNCDESSGTYDRMSEHTQAVSISSWSEDILWNGRPQLSPLPSLWNFSSRVSYSRYYTSSHTCRSFWNRDLEDPCEGITDWSQLPIGNLLFHIFPECWAHLKMCEQNSYAIQWCYHYLWSPSVFYIYSTLILHFILHSSGFILFSADICGLLAPMKQLVHSNLASAEPIGYFQLGDSCCSKDLNMHPRLRFVTTFGLPILSLVNCQHATLLVLFTVPRTFRMLAPTPPYMLFFVPTELTSQPIQERT